MKANFILAIPILTILLLFSSCSNLSEDSFNVNDERLLNVDATPSEWLTYGRNYQENRHSPLNQINKSNIDSLGLAWSISLGTKRGLEATPIVTNGVMYFTGTWSKVYAVDVRKGAIIWTYDPKVPKEWGEKVCCDVVNRGVAIYKNKIFVGSLDGRLIALNAKTGEKEWEVVTTDQSKAYSITGAPRIVKGKVIIGNGGAEYGVRGYVTAYDAETGTQEWRFYTVPGNPNEPFESNAMEEAAKTWTGEWWKFGGGGTVWDAMAFDPELNLLYIGSGNGSPWNRDVRSPQGGDNLYLSSIIALNPDNGELEWHYQTTPGDSWDYTATQHIILVDLKIEGIERKVLMQAPKNGFFYVIDRTNGEFISGEPYVYTNWAKEIDKKTGRPIETEFARYPNMNVQISPHAAGGHNWQPMAFNSKTGLVYIPARENGIFHGQPKNWEFIDDARTWNTASAFNPDNKTLEDSLASRNFGKLIAWNPITQKEAWSVWQKSSWNAGVLTTDDLVFQGNAEGEFCAYDAAMGDKLWSYSLETGIVASPITYEVDGVQYVSILVGWGGVMGIWSKFTKQINPGTLYTFALGKNESIPVFLDVPEKLLVNLDFQASEEQINNGGMLFGQYCGKCHGGGIIPDLTYSRPEIFETFHQIVGEGVLLGLGMPNFGDRLSKNDIGDIKSFLLSQAKSKREKLIE
ncbi:MAG: PQQ-dependent dehydrogenase, methanol/ethanol family [Saprospiraceae bacterium]|nr:PQQ-dependent dehydrogenase, methanol/ethanol family [Saprospiraceae bacterium]